MESVRQRDMHMRDHRCRDVGERAVMLADFPQVDRRGDADRGQMRGEAAGEQRAHHACFRTRRPWSAGTADSRSQRRYPAAPPHSARVTRQFGITSPRASAQNGLVEDQQEARCAGAEQGEEPEAEQAAPAARRPGSPSSSRAGAQASRRQSKRHSSPRGKAPAAPPTWPRSRRPQAGSRAAGGRCLRTGQRPRRRQWPRRARTPNWRTGAAAAADRESGAPATTSAIMNTRPTAVSAEDRRRGPRHLHPAPAEHQQPGADRGGQQDRARPVDARLAAPRRQQPQRAVAQQHGHQRDRQVDPEDPAP